MNKYWVAFFSQTGTELCELSSALGVAPNIIVTNAKESIINPEIYSLGSLIYRLPEKPTLSHYYQSIPYDTSAYDLTITLHGWLRIIPSGFVESYSGKIFNGHPALIDEYPELKGFNKQESVLDRVKYPLIGSVIHEVTAEVDEGQVLYSCRLPNTLQSIADAYATLRKTSLQSWEKFFYDYLQDNKSAKQKSVCWMYDRDYQGSAGSTSKASS